MKKSKVYQPKGRGLKARTEEGQLVEVLTECRILNRMFELREPDSAAGRL